MIFSFGEGWRAKNERLGRWHPFFTLLPRWIGIEDGRDVYVWLQTIERRGEFHDGWDWEYRVKEAA